MGFWLSRPQREEETDSSESSEEDLFEEAPIDNASLKELRAIIASEGLPVSGGIGGIARKAGSGQRGGRTLADIRQDIREARRAKKEIGIAIMILGDHCRCEKTIALQVQPQHTIADVKDMIQNKEGILVDEHCIMYGSKQLEEGRTVFDVDIQQDSVLILAKRS